MKKAFIVATNIISSLGFTTKENFESVKKGISGIKKQNITDEPAWLSSIDKNKIEKIENYEKYSYYENLAILSVNDAIKQTKIDVKSEKTLFIFASTKGNIDLLSNSRFEKDRLYLWKSADVLASFFGNKNKPITISNACISGVAAIIVAKRLIEVEEYDNVIVVGVDILSRFVVSGFQSFKSLSNGICKPFDKNRTGLSLGEAAGTIIITSKPEQTHEHKIIVAAGAISNDANHISGPSRDGSGLFIAIDKAQKQMKYPKIDYISAHGTATLYNDQMEAKAIEKAKLTDVPINSMKAYWGHSLGAAGIIETAITVEAIKEQKIIKTLGFEEIGVEEKINVTTKTKDKKIKNILKIASGFGGCNAAIICSKI